jgi:uncharacterized protein YqeY
MEFLNKYSKKINMALPLGAKKEIAETVGRAQSLISDILNNKIEERKHDVSEETVLKVIQLAIEIINRKEAIGKELEREFFAVSSHS